MRRIFSFVTFLICINVCMYGHSLHDSFMNPPDSVKVGCYYFWVNEIVAPEGEKKDLQWMKDKGITLAYLATDIRNRSSWDNPWAGQEFGDNKFQREKWWLSLLTAFQTASELGIEKGIFNCPGWSQSGGQWVTDDMAMLKWTKDGVKVCKTVRGD